jgi:phosphatidylglycerophosphatase A
MPPPPERAPALHLGGWGPALLHAAGAAAALAALAGHLAAAAVLAAAALAGLPGTLATRRAHLARTGLGATRAGRLASDLATSLGAGLAPRAPGTFGALAGMPLAALVARLPLAAHLAAVAALTALSLAVSRVYMRGRHRASDPQEVVLDETVGVLVACAFVPFTAPWALAAFVAFRAFDIAKPGPVGWVDRRLKTPEGVMLDDVVAGLLAGGVLALARAALDR